MMRKTITFLAVALSIVSFTHPICAQQTERPARIGTLFSGTPKTHGHHVKRLRKGLGNLGYAEGRRYVFVSRWAMGKRKRLFPLAKELVSEKVDVIVVVGASSIRAVKRATKEIPIVVGASATLLKFVGKPGEARGNITGSTYDNYALGTKRLALLKTAVPQVKRVAYLYFRETKRSQTLTLTVMRGTESAGKVMGIAVERIGVNKAEDLPKVFRSMAGKGFEGVILNNHAFLNFHRKLIARLAIENKLPTISERAGFAKAGYLMGYSANRKQMMNRAAAFIVRILKGAKPADLPVEIATHYDLSLNLKTAKKLGISLPPSILLQATEVIE